MAEALTAKSPTSKSAGQTQKPSRDLTHQPALTGPYGDVLSLQRSVGNRAVSQLLELGLSTLPSTGTVLQRKCASCVRAGDECEECRQKHEGTFQRPFPTLLPLVHEVPRSPGQRLEPSTRTFVESHLGPNFGQVRPHLEAPLPVQLKLTVNQSGDQYEREADQIADQVMSMPELEASRSPNILLLAQSLHIQRLCSHREEETQRKPRQEGKGTGPKAGQPPLVSADLEARISSLRGGGRALPDSLRSSMESRFGRDFSQVRIHTDRQSAELARAVTARAFTLGPNIVFAAGQYAPGTREGQRLLVHELTHVVQQGLGAQPNIQRDEGRPEETKKDPAAAGEAALKEVAEIEAKWKEIKSGAPSFTDLKPWIKYGDAVIALIRDHTQAALAASQKGDTHLYGLYLKVLQTDKTMYDFIAWHTVVYANLLAIKPDLERLADSFKADDREFTGRDKAEELLNLLRKLADVFPKQAAGLLQNVSVTETIQVKRGGTIELTITTTNAYTSEDYFKKNTEEAIKLRSAMQVSLSEINKFLANAFVEGLLQTEEALQQYFEARGGRKGKGPKISKPKPKPKAQKKAQEKKPEEKKPEEKKQEEKKKEEAKKKTCATEYPGELNCASLPGGYIYPSAQAALTVLKAQTGIKNLTLHNRAVATGGPCRGRGTHINVRSGGERIASIGCCPCCKDTPAGPVRMTLCRIIY